MSTYVLVAEDDRKQAELIRRYLVHDGYEVTVVHDGGTALGEATRRPPDLLVLDWMLPGLDGLEICRRLRGESELPILMLTARSTEDDLLRGLDLGADDYMTKPFRPRELVARVRTLLRRGRHTARPASEDPMSPTAPAAPTGPVDRAVLTVGRLTVHTDQHQVFVHDRPVNCTPGEFRILCAMAASPDRVFTRSQLLDCLADHGRTVSERTVDVHILNLRKKIETSPRTPQRLLTVHGVGYKLTRGDDGA
ncbi:response regulator transcription factor [Streptomyces heilongjiangensis]|uniref:Response regulator transcription factor n=1 Tax=Streptomyces heilongjiangensis TaxID=945052 RepID=A0ABW1BE68_9ACTN|nr:response regulator transcription factor [Streptomyces heilongjiangensis]MDC2949529.1 response regulator transcription factor [Streptomyces heilongjiangensis]